jgi:hypothetical protein
MAVMGDANVLATKQDLIASIVQRELIEAAVLAPTLRDVSSFATPGSKSISFPRAGSFTVEDRASAATATLQEITYSADQLDLSFRPTVSWVVDIMDLIQSNVAVEAENAARSARGIAKFVDQQIAVELEAVGVATATAGALVTRDIFLEMRKALQDREAKAEKLVFVGSPAQEENLLKINEFINADFGAGQVVPRGTLGRLYGVRVVISNLVDDDEYYMYEDDEAVALGFQKRGTMAQRDAPEYGAGSVLRTMDAMFGVKGLQIGEKGVAGTESALVQKDNNL